MPTHAHPCREAGASLVHQEHDRTGPYPDVMIDIEALANTPDSAPAQIAILFFDRDDPGREFSEHLFEPSPISSIRLGMNITADTVRWWDEKDMVVDLYAGADIRDVLTSIGSIVALLGSSDVRAWSRGNAYDHGILDLLYHRTGIPLPWPFTKVRDVRTWLDGCRFKSDRKNNHHALDDARNQARDIIEATAHIPIVTHGTAAPSPPDPWVHRNIAIDPASCRRCDRPLVAPCELTDGICGVCRDKSRIDSGSFGHRFP